MLVTSILDLKWLPLVAAVDKYGSILLVKCPWGCSEFINCVKDVPLDSIIGSFLMDQRNVKWMCNKDSCQFLQSI